MSQLKEFVVAVPEVVKIGVGPLSSRTVHVIVPVPPVSYITTITVLLTVSPSAGSLNAAVSGGGGAIVTLRVAVAVRPPPSCTVRSRR